MSFPVFLDTCVLYPATLADTLLRLAEIGVFRPHWSADVLSELRRNLASIESVGEGGADRRIEAMNASFDTARVTGYEPFVERMACEPKDRHVLAADVVSGCQLIVTYNLRDFPEPVMSSHDMQAVHPDVFLLDQFDLYPRAVVHALAAQVSQSSRPAFTPLMLLAALERCGVPRFATEVRRKVDVSAWQSGAGE